jgi:hypothetical protein
MGAGSTSDRGAPAGLRGRETVAQSANRSALEGGRRGPLPLQQPSRSVRSLRAVGLADALGQGHDDPFRPTHIRHAPDLLVLTDATDKAVAVRGEALQDGIEVVDLE